MYEIYINKTVHIEASGDRLPAVYEATALSVKNKLFVHH